MAENKDKEGQVSFKDTLNLPTTDFPIRPNSKEDDPKMIQRWVKEDLYKKTFEKNEGREKFILHDGPPFANGHLHLGHAYNNTLKDIIAKSQRMMSKHVPVTPGWDCHGLPIEFNVNKENPGLSKVETKKKCREYAQKWVDIQKEERRSLGVLMDFENPYLTMNYGYEASVIRAFGKFVQDGYIERKNKAVAWCYSCQTVLASAEIEYQDRKDPSIYVQFPIQNSLARETFKELENLFIENACQSQEAGCINILIWTTTPWTLPLNRAVVVKPKEKYVVLNISGKNVILGKNLVQKLCLAMGQEGKILLEFDSERLQGLKVNHPFIKDLQVPVIFDPFVQTDEGTACVHCAPGCGLEDYETGVKNGLEIFSPISADGRYTKGVLPSELEGMYVVQVLRQAPDLAKALADKQNEPEAGEASSKVKAATDKQNERADGVAGSSNGLSEVIAKDGEIGQIWVIKKLTELDLLLCKSSIKHSFPHCWRCRNGLIFRATKQWFCDLSKNNFKERALQACDGIKTLPENSINRLKAAIESRLEWCLSRQRVWGVPIAALICNRCDTTFAQQEFVDQVAAQVEKHGIEYWDTVSTQELCDMAYKIVEKAGTLNTESADKKLVCKNCGASDFSKENDILDVWFESGVSHYAVLKQRKDLGYPADVYIEGKDQHRGWFQSSLLTSLVLNDQACMKNIVTHGFTVDQKGVKMSKSLGNVVSAAQMIEKLGTDGLRLWAANIDFSSEAVVSEILLKNVQEVFRKIRNTERFLLSNLYDFDKEKDAVGFNKMLLIDKYAIENLYKLNKEIIFDYDRFDFTAVSHKLADYVTKDLSSFYLDIIKDRLYVEKADGLLRKSAQTACWYILDTLTRLIAPIMSFTAEQVSDCYQKDKKESIHLQEFANLENALKKVCEEPEPLLNPGIAERNPFYWYCNTKEAVDLMKAIAKNEQVWQVLKDVRAAILKSIEVQREKQVLCHSLEANVTVYFDMQDDRLSLLRDFFDELNAGQQGLIGFFKEFLIVSQFTVAEVELGLENSGIKGLFVSVKRAEGQKCPRCWNWSTEFDKDNLCKRCQSVLLG